MLEHSPVFAAKSARYCSCHCTYGVYKWGREGFCHLRTPNCFLFPNGLFIQLDCLQMMMQFVFKFALPVYSETTTTIPTTMYNVTFSLKKNNLIGYLDPAKIHYRTQTLILWPDRDMQYKVSAYIIRDER